MHSTHPAAAAAPRARVLVVDDDPAVREALVRRLAFEGYEVDAARDGLEALDRLAGDRGAHPDLVLLDVTMPGLDGLTATRRIRAAGDTVPILLLTARDTLGDRVAGLDTGADDYLAKPFSGDELLARVRALLRRGRAGRCAAPPPGTDGRLVFRDLVMEPLTRTVTRAGRRLELTRTEFTLLRLFLGHPRRVLTRAAILREVWGFDFEPASNTLDVYVMYLRRKTEAGGLPRLIHTERGTGYVLREPRTAGDTASYG